MTDSNISEPLTARSLEYAENYVPLSEEVAQARNNAVKAGTPVPSKGVLAFLTFIAKTIKAENVVEIGTGTGVSGLSLLQGMTGEVVLTSIDSQTEWQAQARKTFRDAGYASHHFRLIAGIALEVLDNLRDGAYDIVFVNGDELEYGEYVAQAQRLLRPGGILVLHDALWNDLVANPKDDSDEALIIREALQAILDEESLTPTMLPLGNGLVAALKN